MKKPVKHLQARQNRYKRSHSDPAPGARRWSRLALRCVAGAAAIAAMSLLFVFGYDWLTQCAYFRAETIRVIGNERLAAEHVIQAAGVRTGVNILSVNLKTARRRLLSDPWIAEASIRRDFPGSLAIRIREHRPAAVIDLGRRFLVNARGEIFKEAGKGAGTGLPLITGADYADWRSGGDGRSMPVRAAVMDVLRLGRQKHSAVPACRILEIRADPDLGLALKVEGLPVETIQLGYGAYEDKYRRLERIFKYLRDLESPPVFEKMDLRNPDRIVARPGKEDEGWLTKRRKEA